MQVTISVDGTLFDCQDGRILASGMDQIWHCQAHGIAPFNVLVYLGAYSEMDYLGNEIRKFMKRRSDDNEKGISMATKKETLKYIGYCPNDNELVEFTNEQEMPDWIDWIDWINSMLADNALLEDIAVYKTTDKLEFAITIKKQTVVDSVVKK